MLSKRPAAELLKNENGILPLEKNRIKTLAVLGPNAYPAVIGGGGSSLTKPFNSVSYLEGISNYLGKSVRVDYVIEDLQLDEIVKNTQFVASPAGPQGLKGEYFNNDSLEGAPALIRTDERIGFRWAEGSYVDGGPIDHFSVRWSGYFIPRTDDDYKFFISADDGVRLYVNDQRVIDDWQRHGETLDTYSAHLEQGKPYKILLEYFENVGTATARFGIAPATRSLEASTRAAAAKADAVVLCMGFDPSSEGEGFDRTFRLPGGQDAFIQQVAAINKNVIVVLTAGGNVDMTRWIDSVPGLIHAWYPGQEGGNYRRLSSAAGKTTRHLTAIIRRRPTSALSTKKEFSSATAISIAPKSSRFFPLAMGFPTPLFNTAVCPYHHLLPILALPSTFPSISKIMVRARAPRSLKSTSAIPMQVFRAR